MLLYGGHTTSIDEETYLAGLRSFLHVRTNIDLSVTPADILVTTPGRNGLPTSIYGFGTTLFYLPMYVAGKIVSFLVADEWKEQVLRLFLLSSNSIALGFSAALIYRTAQRLGASRNCSIGGACAFGLGSYALASAGTGFTEILTGMFLILSFELLIRHRGESEWRVIYAGLAIGGAFLMRPSALIFVPIFLTSLVPPVLVHRRLQKMLYFGIGTIPPFGAMLSYNWWKWGNPLDTGYPPLQYNTPWYEGLYGLFLSSGKGLVWFAPITFVALVFAGRAFRSNMFDAATLWIAVVANAFLFCRFEVWSGDDAFGPRYMTIVLPLLAVLAIIGSTNLNPKSVWIAGICGLPAAIGGSLVYVNASNFARLNTILTVVGRSSRTDDGSFDWTRTRRSVNFIPRLSQLFEHVTSIPRAATESWRSIGHHIAPFAVDTRTSLSWYASRVRLDVWWLYWIESGAPIYFVGLLAIPGLMIIRGTRGLKAQLEVRSNL